MTGRMPSMRKEAANLERVDRKVARKTGHQRDSALMRAVGGIRELADQPPLIALSAATIAAGILLQKGQVTLTGIRMFASHWLATKAKTFIKHRIDRTRPFVMLDDGSYHARKGQSRAPRENSFPSGHTAGAVAIARAVARDFPATARIGYTAAAAAGAVQLPRGKHYLSDVLVGAAIGLIAEGVISLIIPARLAKGAEIPGDPYENRTRVFAVRGRRPNR